MLVAPVANAQERNGFAVGRFDPAERGARFFVVDALDFRAPAIGAVIDYAYKPLVVTDAAGGEKSALVRHQLFLHAGGSFVFADRVRIGLDLPVALYQDGEPAVVRGETFRAANGTALGDLRFALDAIAIGKRPFSLGLGVRAWFPTGSRASFTSDGTVRIAVQTLAAGEVGLFAWGARFAYVVRSRDHHFVNAVLGDEVAGAIGGGVRMSRWFVGPELFASARVDGGMIPVDALLGASYELGSGVRVALGAGSGLTNGPGAPRARGVAMFEWSAPIPVPDRDKDGIADSVDACPDAAGPPSGDPEQNGCPPPAPVEREDADGDGIADVDDACPTLPGPPSPDPRTNGCPTLAVVTATQIRIEQQIRFATNSAELVASDAVLLAVKRVLEEHPEIEKVRVEGHTDDTGDDELNDDLSARRAAAVVAWLVREGVDPKRLDSAGYGRRRPLEPNTTEEARAKNRRVELTIVRRTP